MKTLFTTLFLAFSSLVGYGQSDEWCQFDFENNIYCNTDYLWIDTISNTNNIWQIGSPQKVIFNSGVFSTDNAIVTDLSNSYPINDTSMFTCVHIVSDFFSDNNIESFRAFYKVDSDSLLDYGTIEFSPNNGITWINLLNDTIYQQYYTQNPYLSLTGTSSNWKSFEFYLQGLFPVFDIEVGDTVLYRFTFISDNIETNREGLMFDNIIIEETILPDFINENALTTFSSTLYPNPAHNSATINSELKINNGELKIVNILGEEVLHLSIINFPLSIDISQFPPGIYQYQLFAEKEKKQSFGKFVVE